MRHVLIVDDDLSTRETYQAALHAAGFIASLAGSGQAAHVLLESRADTDAMLLDLNLGDMSGYDLLRWMRAAGRRLPTAVLTAFRANFDPDEAFELGATAYVDQPLSIDDIVALAERLTRLPLLSDGPQALHEQVLRAVPGALDLLHAIFMEVLPVRLSRAYPRVPFDFAEDAAIDACLEYALKPTRCDASRVPSVVDFVFMIARRNLIDRLRLETALRSREEAYVQRRNNILLPVVSEARGGLDLWAAIVAVTVDPRELRAAKLWLDAASWKDMAQGLGLGHLPQGDQHREVKRFKDRLIKRLSRYFSPSLSRSS